MAPQIFYLNFLLGLYQFLILLLLSPLAYRLQVPFLHASPFLPPTRLPVLPACLSTRPTTHTHTPPIHPIPSHRHQLTDRLHSSLNPPTHPHPQPHQGLGQGWDAYAKTDVGTAMADLGVCLFTGRRIDPVKYPIAPVCVSVHLLALVVGLVLGLCDGCRVLLRLTGRCALPSLAHSLTHTST
jgi:hypothetical protein